jgi:hypothetical protein
MTKNTLFCFCSDTDKWANHLKLAKWPCGANSCLTTARVNKTLTVYVNPHETVTGHLDTQDVTMMGKGFHHSSHSGPDSFSSQSTGETRNLQWSKINKYVYCWHEIRVCGSTRLLKWVFTTGKVGAAFSFDIHSSAFHKRTWTACLSVTPVITLAMRSIKHSRVHIALVSKTSTISAYTYVNGGWGPLIGWPILWTPTANPENRKVVTQVPRCMQTDTAGAPPC